MRRQGLGWVTAVLVATLLGSAPASADDGHALTGPQDAVAWFSDPGDVLVGADNVDTHLWRGTDTAITLARAGDGVVLSVGTDGTNDFHRIELQPPPGGRLAPGAYPDPAEPGSQHPGQAGLEIAVGDQGCGGPGGFEIRDVAWDADGVPTRLWAVFSQSCAGSGGPAHWGEIRVGEPQTAAPIVVPSTVRWPEVDLGTGHREVPATVIAGTQAAAVQGTGLSGAQASDFAVAADGCAGRTLAPGATCPVEVGFTPPVSGTREATLTIGTSAGAVSAALQGWTFGGITRVHVTGDSDDWITQGGTYDYTPANAGIRVFGGDARSVLIGVGGWTFEVATARGGTLVAPMTYNNASSAQANLNGSAPVLTVTAPGRGCGDGNQGAFTMRSLSHRPETPLATEVSFSFDEHCTGETAMGHGTVQFREGDRTVPAPWMAADAVPGAVGGGGGGGATGGASPGDGTVSGAGVGAPARPGTPRPATARRAAPLLKFIGLVGKGGRTLRFAAQLPRAGTLTARVTVRLHGRTLALGDGRVVARRAGSKTINIGLRKSVLKALAHVRSTLLTATVTWRPRGARAIPSHATGVLRLRR